MKQSDLLAGLSVFMPAGGEGRRLRPETLTTPKVLLPYRGSTMLGHSITLAQGQGVRRFLISVRYKSHDVRSYVAASLQHVEVAVVEDTGLEGNFGAVRRAIHSLSDPFAVWFPDTDGKVDLAAVVQQHFMSRGEMTCCVQPAAPNVCQDLLRCELGFLRSIVRAAPTVPGDDVTFAPLFVLNKSTLDLLPTTGPVDITKNHVPALLASGRRILTYRLDHPMVDLGTPRS